MTWLAHILRGAARIRPLRSNAAVAAAAKWKVRAADLVEQVQDLSARLAGVQQSLRQAKDHGAVIRREVPSAAVLRQAFFHRVRTLPARAGARAAQSLEEPLFRASAPYRAALDATTDLPAPATRRISLDGLTWWVPDTAVKGRTGPSRTAGQRIPYHGFLQTRELSVGGIMLDLGANVGRMSIPRVVLGDAIAAYCAEPDPVNFACLARNVLDNGLRGLVLPDQTAIGDRNGTVRLLRVGRPGAFRVVSDAAAADGPSVDVPCYTLDAWVERLQIDLDAVTFIKVDVQGFERRVVAGAGRVLGCPHIAWQVEVEPALLRAAGDDPHELYTDLQRHFTHFIDLNQRAAGPRVRPLADLPSALRYIEPDGKTDVLLFSGGGAS